ncbi:MAG: site-specific integrase [Gaiella sp.]|nr:site-specific integrase [Gaiella sp.]
MADGLRERHARSCRLPVGGRCSCKGGPTIEASVYSKLDGKKLRRTFRGKGARTAAKHWRASALGQVRDGTMRFPSPMTMGEALDAYLLGMADGTIRNRRGDHYKPSAVRAYRQAVEVRLRRPLGGKRMADLTRAQLQDLTDRWQAEGLSASTIRNTLLPLYCVFGRAIRRGVLTVNPTLGLELPAVRGRRDRVVAPADAAVLIAALTTEHDRAVWATAFYAGLRFGELRALRWEDVTLDTDAEIHVTRSWDAREGEIEPKSKAGKRDVPVITALRLRLVEHRLRSGRTTGLVFGPDGDRPFQYESLIGRARKAWTTANEKRAQKELPAIEPLTLHDARHTCASLWIAAGVNIKAISTFMGHASVTITLDRYGHLFPDSSREAAGLLNRFLAAGSESR